MNLKWFTKNYIDISLAVTLILLLFTATLTLLNKNSLEKSTSVRNQVEAAKGEFTFHVDQTMRHMDVGLRGYAIIHDRRYLYRSPEMLMKEQDLNNKKLDSILVLQDYNDQAGLAAIRDLRKFIDDYLLYFNEMVEALDKGDSVKFKTLFLLDKGASHGTVFSIAKGFLFQFEDALDAKATQNYKAAMDRSLYLQIILLIVGMPCLILVYIRLKNERTNQFKLLTKLETTNRQYLFDPGIEIKALDAETVVEDSVKNLKYAADFLTKISEGNYTLSWQGMTEQTKKLNTQNLAGKILSLQNDLLKIKQEEEKRFWANEGLALFAEVLRTKNGSLKELGENVLKQIITYLKANQGAFYIVNDDSVSDQFIEMIACYAYERKKHITRRINIGEGLIGQAVLEGEVTIIKNVPKGYLSITSGLGGAEPNFLLIVPIKAESKIYGVLEIASFQIMQEYEIKFLERISQSIASAVGSAKTNLKTQNLLHETQQQTERLRAQEEEMRQNMEELQAIQEQIERDKKLTK
jgi:putative methionine-R-sulfoxide reductase with GAF domain